MAFPKLVLDDFSKGLNTTSAAHRLELGEVRDNRNLRIRDRGRVEHRGGQRNIVTGLAGVVRSMTRYVSGSNIGTSNYQLVMALKDPLFPAEDDRYVFYRYNSSGGSVALIGPAGGVEGPVPPGFAHLYGKVWCPAFVFDGTGTRDVGMASPGSAPAVADAGAGNLNSTGGDDYQWCFTYYSPTLGIETNPSPLSSALALVNRQADVTIPSSGDTDFPDARVYRIGGASTVAAYSGQISIPGASAVYTDNVADGNLGDRAPYDHDPLPATAGPLMVAHKDRLVASGYETTGALTRIYYSKRYSPHYWGVLFYDEAEEETEDIQSALNWRTCGGYRDIDADYSDPIQAFASLGDVLVVFRKKSIYRFAGENELNFVIQKHNSAVGICGPLAVATCENVPIFVGSDGMVYAMEGNGIRPIGLPIESSLDAISKSVLNKAWCVYHKQEFICVFPDGANTKAFAFDLRYNSWRNLSGAEFAFGCGISDLAAGDDAELLCGTATGYTSPDDGTTPTGVVAALTDDATKLFIDLTLGELDFGLPSISKRVRGARVIGSITPAPGETVTLRLTTKQDRGSDTVVDYTIASGSVPLDRMVSAALKGRRVVPRIFGYVTACDIQGIELDYAVLGDQERS